MTHTLKPTCLTKATALSASAHCEGEYQPCSTALMHAMTEGSSGMQVFGAAHVVLSTPALKLYSVMGALFSSTTTCSKQTAFIGSLKKSCCT